MPLRVTNNVYSINAQRNLNRNQVGLQKSLERLSSGFRVNRAGDDAAGLAISEKLRSNIRALAQASRNASDGVALIQVAEGAMEEIDNMLIRMKELSEQAATGTVSTAERAYLDTEYSALASEITRISDNTKFNSTYLLDGTLSIRVQVGLSSGANDQITIAVGDIDSTSLLLTTGIDTVTNAQLALATTTSAISTVSSRRADLGAMQNRLESIIANIDTVNENLTGAESRIRDVDVAGETASLTKYNILVQAGVSVLMQANQTPQIALQLLRG
jgi:flagellin